MSIEQTRIVSDLIEVGNINIVGIYYWLNGEFYIGNNHILSNIRNRLEDNFNLVTIG